VGRRRALARSTVAVDFFRGSATEKPHDSETQSSAGQRSNGERSERQKNDEKLSLHGKPRSFWRTTGW